MKIRDYIKTYTSKNMIYFQDVLGEIKEFIAEILRLNKRGIAEEGGDIFLALQAWLCSRFNVNGEIWRIAQKAADKFANRKIVWEEIYTYVGLDKNISGYVGNYARVEKVINHLASFGIDREKAKEAYKIIVFDKLEQ